MPKGRTRTRSSLNPFISLTDILFNFILVLVFATAIFAQDISRQFQENRAFQDRLSQLQLERDALREDLEGLTGELEDARALEGALREANAALEERIAGLVGNLDLARARQRRLAEELTVVLGELGESRLESEALRERITVVLGDLGAARAQTRLLEDEIAIVTGDLEEARQVAGTLREQVSQLSRNNFLVVELEWLTASHDLDLHVTDPDGRRFYWSQPTYADSSARLTLDNRIGARPNKPGLEIWTARELRLGTYRIEVGLWGCGRTSETARYQPCTSDGAATVLIRHRDGDDVIGDISIPSEQTYARVSGQGVFDNLILVAEVEVFEDDGELRLRVDPAPGLSLTRLAGE